MKQISSMFLRNITCIDHAFIDSAGLIEGGSYHQEIVITGEVDEYEQVVVDFSAVKKQIKAIIDDKEKGFDHKLWIIKGFSKCVIDDLGDGNVKVTTPNHELIAPWNALKIIDVTNQYSDFASIVEYQMQQEIQDGLNEANGVNFIRINLKLTRETFSKDAKTFTYFHGLKHSSSWGCNNIAHGHFSFVEVYDDLGHRIDEVEKIIAYYLNGAMMIFKENLVSPGKIAYETPRGKFSLTFSDKVKTILMDKETTIENIIEHVCHEMRHLLKYYAASRIFISEGLQKGATKQINYK